MSPSTWQATKHSTAEVDVNFQAGAESVIATYRHRPLQLLVEGAPHILPHRITTVRAQPLHPGPETLTTNDLPITTITIITSIVTTTPLVLGHRFHQPTKLLHTLNVRTRIDPHQLVGHCRLIRTPQGDVLVRSNLATTRGNTDILPTGSAITTVVATRHLQTETIDHRTARLVAVRITILHLVTANLLHAHPLETSDDPILLPTTSYRSWQLPHAPKKQSLAHVVDPPRYREREEDRGYARDYDRDYRRSRDYDRGGRREYHDRRERYREEREPDAMYGRGGPPRQPIPPRAYADPRYSQSPQYPPPGPSPPHAQSPYGRPYPQQQAYASYQGSPVHAAYSAAASPYYQQNYPAPGASPYYQAQQPPPHYPAPPQMSAYPPQPSYRGAPSRGYNNPHRPTAPASGPAPSASRGGRGGHFSNLSWTPSNGNRGGRTASKRENSISGTETPLAPGSATGSVDDDDNPFRPPKDLRAEDESEKRKSGISFSIKGMAGRADPSAPHKPAPLTAPRTRKQMIQRSRLIAKPKLTAEYTGSDSVYYRKTGNESVVGSGTYGKVYKAVHVYTGDKVALKKIRMEGERDGFPVTAIREIKLLQSLNHTNVVRLQEVMVERNDCFMIFEYLSHDLTGLLNHPSFVLTEGHKKDLAKQLFESLDYLHKRGVLHRDIKAANILVSRHGELKLADFGLARFYNKNAKRKQDYTNRVITIWYRSPELLLGETQYGPAVDIWSAACVLVEIFTKHAIFPGDGGEINQLDKIYNVLGTPSRSNWPGIVDLAWYELLRPMHKVPSTFADKYQERVSPAAFDLLSAMLVFDPDTRPTASDVLEHPYFTTEEPKADKVVELENLQGDWHEFESKALRKEKEREARKKDKESAEKRKLEGPAGDERELKRIKTADAQA
ncbi:Pkinase-domain-containing protein [Aureobasidium subglaciale]|nr:Pkinase-domain-containing protein [Aureobasidium subglaciale]KAI5230416.1 Pkinase-domain-containing protein [Aureobasidium subglaciale]KAI5233705.1 Pkinase-domain-containing protein [Aureobasidium subglaciale]KAI5266952.1 Pkinase-domain-containing protein [Aureobasidium subglaciale]